MKKIRTHIKTHSISVSITYFLSFSIQYRKGKLFFFNIIIFFLPVVLLLLFFFIMLSQAKTFIYQSYCIFSANYINQFSFLCRRQPSYHYHHHHQQQPQHLVAHNFVYPKKTRKFFQWKSRIYTKNSIQLLLLLTYNIRMYYMVTWKVHLCIC